MKTLERGFGVDIAWNHDRIESGDYDLIHTRSSHMAADIFTKPVEKAKFVRMRDYIMNVHSTLRNSLEDAMMCAVGASLRMMSNLRRRL